MIPWNKIRTVEIERDIVNLYIEGLSASEINLALGSPFKTTKSIYDVLRKYNIKIRNSSDYRIINDYCFTFIDTEQKAYWLGFLLTDGWVQSKNGVGQKEIGIQLQARDAYILENLKLLFQTNNQIMEVSKKAQGREWKMARLVVSSDQIAEDLARFGVVPNKTPITKIYPNLIPKEHFRHFIRGIFDGDGSTHLDKSNQLRIKWYGLYNLVEFINHYLWQEIDTPYRDNIAMSSVKDAIVPIYQLEFSAHADIQKIYKFLYQDASVYLKRKEYIICSYLQQKLLQSGQSELSQHLG